MTFWTCFRPRSSSEANPVFTA